MLLIFNNYINNNQIHKKFSFFYIYNLLILNCKNNFYNLTVIKTYKQKKNYHQHHENWPIWKEKESFLIGFTIVVIIIINFIYYQENQRWSKKLEKNILIFKGNYFTLFIDSTSLILGWSRTLRSSKLCVQVSLAYTRYISFNHFAIVHFVIWLINILKKPYIFKIFYTIINKHINNYYFKRNNNIFY